MTIVDTLADEFLVPDGIGSIQRSHLPEIGMTVGRSHKSFVMIGNNDVARGTVAITPCS